MALSFSSNSIVSFSSACVSDSFFDKPSSNFQSEVEKVNEVHFFGLPTLVRLRSLFPAKILPTAAFEVSVQRQIFCAYAKFAAGIEFSKSVSKSLVDL